ncbi:hypothetical protein, partial [Klebsiella pneumoniae]|uniref:hypothetical protein n=1 Tax=Klebsiella pneumoniae TaxID=573 RepID=UPI00273A0489
YVVDRSQLNSVIFYKFKKFDIQHFIMVSKLLDNSNVSHDDLEKFYEMKNHENFLVNVVSLNKGKYDFDEAFEITDRYHKFYHLLYFFKKRWKQYFYESESFPY